MALHITPQRPRPPVAAQNFPGALQLAQIAPDGLLTYSKAVRQRLGAQRLMRPQEPDNLLLTLIFHPAAPAVNGLDCTLFIIAADARKGEPGRAGNTENPDNFRQRSMRYYP